MGVKWSFTSACLLVPWCRESQLPSLWRLNLDHKQTVGIIQKELFHSLITGSSYKLWGLTVYPQDYHVIFCSLFQLGLRSILPCRWACHHFLKLWESGLPYDMSNDIVLSYIQDTGGRVLVVIMMSKASFLLLCCFKYLFMTMFYYFKFLLNPHWLYNEDFIGFLDDFKMLQELYTWHFY